MDFIKSILVLVVAMLVVGQATAQVQFEDITVSAGGPFRAGESWGASWGHMDEDVYPDIYSNNHGTLPSLLRNNGDGTFSDNVGIADLEQIWLSEPLADTHGGAWADYDNDGDQDLFATRSSIGARFHLFENDGQGFFEEVGGPRGIGGNGGGRLPALFDYNNDGRLDVSLQRNGNEARVFKWEGTKFFQKTSEVGLSGECGKSNSGLVSDLFDTGTINYICRSETEIPYGAYDTSTIPFTDISAQIDRIGTNSDAVLADFNNDLKMDLFALRGLVRPSGVEKISDNRIEAWMSAGGKTDFEKTITFAATGPITVAVYARVVDDPNKIFIGSTGYNPATNPVTLDPADPNNWGTFANHAQLGVFIEYDEIALEWTISLSGGGNGGGEAGYFVIDGTSLGTPTITGLKGVDLPREPRFLLNNGTQLVDSSSRGIGSIMCGGIAAADFDNDMDVDLYLTCRTSVENVENRLYLNDGSGNFSLAAGPTGGEGLIGLGIDSGAGTAEMAITADLDIDGFVDLFVTNGNRLFPHIVQDGFSAGGPDRLIRNLGGNGNHWLEFDLEGVISNRDGFGAKVIVTAGGVSQLREQNGQYHRWSHDHKRLHFGLAANTTADVSIEWPDGTTDTHTNVSVDKLYRATQAGALTDITPIAGAPTLSIDSTTAQEGNDATLTVTLSAEPGLVPVSVDYKIVEGTATAGQDYQDITGTLVFQNTETTKPIVISTLVDVLPEANETFVVSLYNSSNTITQSTSVVTIEDVAGAVCGEPDYTPGVDKGLFIWQDCEGTGNWLIRTTAGGGPSTRYNVNLATDTSVTSVVEFSFEGSDFHEVSPSGKQLDVQMTMSNSGQDGIEFALSPDGELCLSLIDLTHTIYVGVDKNIFTSPVNMKALGDACVPDLPVLSVVDTTISENAGSVDVTVNLSEAYASPVSASFATVDGLALAGLDYTAVSGTVDFLPGGALSQTVNIPILQDNLIESSEDFSLVLSNPSNADIIDADGVVVIEDDEVNPCGEPSYSPSTDAGFFLWQDCGVTDKWFVRATAGGGSAITYTASVVSDAPITSLVEFSFEGIDSAILSNSDQQLDLTMKMANAGVDGVEFSLQTGSTCVDVDAPPGTDVTVGQNNATVTPPFDIFTFDPC